MPTQNNDLRKKIETVFRDHVEKDDGLIAGPDRLLERLLRKANSDLR